MRADVASLPQSEATSVSAAIAMKRCPPMLRQFCCAFAGENSIPPRTRAGSIRVAPKKRQPAGLLLQNEASAGDLE
jgi:hypothetical protein